MQIEKKKGCALREAPDKIDEKKKVERVEEHRMRVQGTGCRDRVAGRGGGDRVAGEESVYKQEEEDEAS